MKKTLTLLITLCTLSALSFAQENCKLCGTWIGSWTGTQINTETEQYDYGTWKIYIRINKYGDNYKIRIKKEFPDHGWTRYVNDDCTILDVDANSIHFKLTSSLLYSLVNNVVTYSNEERYYSLVYLDGYAHLTLNAVIGYEYDRNRRFIKKYNGLPYKVKTPEDDIDLFKDEENW